KKIAPSQPCVRCGDPASRRVDGKDVPEDTCSQCFHAFVSTRSRIDAGVKLRKEREIIRRRTRAGRVNLGLGVVFPGAGHVYFVEGNVVKAEQSSRERAELLGNMLVRAGVVTGDQLDTALVTQERTLRRLGDILIEIGACDRAALKEMARLQTTETIYRLFM